MLSPCETARPGHDAIVIVNSRAGTMLQAQGNGLIERLTEDLSAHGVRLLRHVAEHEDIGAAVRQARRDHPDAALLVAGGDGTVSRLLPDLKDSGAAFGVVPLGTLNLLARDLGLVDDPDGLALAIARREPVPVDLGEVNTIPFHSNVGIGFSARMARERELARQHFPFSKAIGFVYAAMRTLLLSRPIDVELEIDGKPKILRADAVLVTNNRFHGAPWRRPRLDEGLIEIHLMRSEGLAARFSVALSLWRGTWRSSDKLTSYTCRAAVIRKGRRSRQAFVAIDGELRRVNLPLHLTIRPAAVRIFRPPISMAKAVPADNTPASAR